MTNLFILFAPGLGGNHLANLFSLDSKFQTRFTEETYKDIHNQVVTNDVFPVHISLQNISVNSIKKILPTLVNRNNVMCGHWLEYVWLKQSPLIKYFPNRTFCVIQMPDIDSSLAAKRFKNHCSDPMPWIYYELELLYKVENIAKLIDEDDSDFYHVCPDLLTNRDIKLLFDDLKNQGLEFEIDMDVAQYYHTIWIEQNFKDSV